jgi:hypothetical protein
MIDSSLQYKLTQTTQLMNLESMVHFYENFYILTCIPQVDIYKT